MGALFHGLTLDAALKRCMESGLDAIELPVGCYPGAPFFDPAEVLASAARQKEIRTRIAAHGLEVSALAVHGNPVHPDAGRAAEDHEAFLVAIELAPLLGTQTVVNFSGCPGGAPGDRVPCWVTCAWPGDYADALKWQWDEVLVPYWASIADRARKAGVRIAWEAHPGFAVYNPDTLLRLSQRAEAQSRGGGAPVLGANLDPSHFFWQGIDPVLAAQVLGEAGLLFYCHAKDTEIDRAQTALNGTLDARAYTDLKHRSWNFRTVGWGHGDEFWKPFLSMLRRYGYDGVISIEHEDALMSVDEGLSKAIAYLRGLIIREQAGKAWWV